MKALQLLSHIRQLGGMVTVDADGPRVTSPSMRRIEGRVVPVSRATTRAARRTCHG